MKFHDSEICTSRRHCTLCRGEGAQAENFRKTAALAYEWDGSCPLIYEITVNGKVLKAKRSVAGVRPKGGG